MTGLFLGRYPNYPSPVSLRESAREIPEPAPPGSDAPDRANVQRRGLALTCTQARESEETPRSAAPSFYDCITRAGRVRPSVGITPGDVRRLLRIPPPGNEGNHPRWWDAQDRLSRQTRPTR